MKRRSIHSAFTGLVVSLVLTVSWGSTEEPGQTQSSDARLKALVCDEKKTVHQREPGPQEAAIEERIATIKQDYGVTVHYHYSKETFLHPSWHSFIEGEQVSPTHASIMLDEIEKFLTVVPRAVTRKNLENIYMFNSLLMHGRGTGAMAFGRSIYLGAGNAAHIANCLYHEFGHILLAAYPVDLESWMAQLPPDFEYYGVGNEMLVAGINPFESNDELHSQGFVLMYSKASLSEDHAVFSDYLFTRQEKTRELMKKHPAMKNRVRELIRYYKAISDEYDFSFYDDVLNSPPPCPVAVSGERGETTTTMKAQGTAAVWKSEPPGDCPFPQSEDFPGIVFAGRYANYTDADTWYPSWGRDDKLYSPFTDTIGNGVNGMMARSDREGDAVVGHATIVGDDPMDLTVVNPGTIPGPGNPQYPGRYPCASLHHDGIWYIGTYGLNGGGYGGFNWPILGPFGGFHISSDHGETWTPSPLSTDVGNALFPEPEHHKGPVKMGSPHVVDFGKNMEHSPDGNMYLVAHGSTQMDEEERKANLSWITGDQVYLSRVTPSPETVNDESQYEYFAGHKADGTAVWSTKFADLKPIAEWNNNMGCVTITYNAPLKKYMMVVTDGWPTVGDMNTYILESDQITGPWKLVHYLTGFGPQGYFVNIPSKFISEDGRSAWLLFSANFAYRDIRLNEEAGTPVGSRYSMSWQKIHLPETIPDLEEATLVIRPFTNAADLHLTDDGFKTVYAVNVSDGGTSPLSVNGVAFKTCGPTGTDVPGVTVTGKAVGDWGDQPTYGRGTDNDNLAAIMHDIRYADGSDAVTASAAVEPGRTYKLMLLFSENYYKEPGKRTFGFEINGVRFPRTFDVNQVTGPWSDNPAAGVVVEHEFVADDDGVRIVLSRGINAPDTNPILNAFTLSTPTNE